MTGIDARRPLTPDEVDAIDAGMDRYAVLVLPGQDISDEQQLAFTRNFGPLEEGANSTVRTSGAAPRSGLRRRLQPRQGRASKLARDNKRRMAALGNRLWHSDASFRVVPAKYSILSGRIVTTDGGNTEFADMRAAYDALDAATKAEIEDLVCEHSLIYLARPARLHRVPARRARGDEAGAPSAGAHPSDARAASRCSCRPISAPSSAGRSPRRWPSSAT